jgi:hypothetical protein
MRARGMGPHKRQVHFIMKDSVTIVRDDKLDDVTIVTNVYKPPDTLLYTELDLKIILGKICRLAFNEDGNNLLSKMATNRIAFELIQEFEKRFDCKFSDARKAFPNVKPAETDMENYTYISFADL